MTSNTSSHNTAETTHANGRASSGVKAATKTTEFFVYVAMVLATVITALVVGDNGENTEDAFNAAQAMQYITYLTIGYMLARGLAKSGNRHGTYA
ncbi:hypothetical protein GCM10023081_39030 [Arthrobacter ginkgonis]|uniref:Uncharacterized protein n=2 Tax=Actinomycetes TaxID=1760 RepID=A0ABP7D4K0_9MICC